jgi:hypothetical protein
MSARTQHGLALGLTVLLLAACGSTSSPGDGGTDPPSPVVPAIPIEGLQSRDASLGLDVAMEAVHPDAFADELAKSGFAGGTERTLTGRHGVFSRVAIRGWSFATAEGAASFLTWLQGNAAELIGEAQPVDTGLPDGVVLKLHSPTGCCHEEVPIYLAAWQRDTTVWTIRASGARIHTAPALALVRSVEKET